MTPFLLIAKFFKKKSLYNALSIVCQLTTTVYVFKQYAVRIIYDSINRLIKKTKKYYTIIQKGKI